MYEIADVRTAISKYPAPDGSPVNICQFDLRRLPDQEQVQTKLERHVVDVLDELSDESRYEERFPRARSVRVRRLIRDTAAAQRIKHLHGGECQLCGLRLLGPDGRPYSEGAHIRPLGKPHNGPDVEPNIICLCPNCHVRLDMGAVTLDDDRNVIPRAPLSGVSLLPQLMVREGHYVHPAYLRYHREYWERQGRQAR
ncbi:HNH endonuclease [Streptomyces sp. PAM3C]|nr:HNH endonuclease [Streptomyces sp. PAM3C]